MKTLYANSMPRNTKIVNMSLPKEIYREMNDIAKKKRVSRSELLRDALTQYVVSDSQWQEIYRGGEASARKLKVKDERDVERLVHEFRRDAGLK